MLSTREVDRCWIVEWESPQNQPYCKWGSSIKWRCCPPFVNRFLHDHVVDTVATPGVQPGPSQPSRCNPSVWPLYEHIDPQLAIVIGQSWRSSKSVLVSFLHRYYEWPTWCYFVLNASTLKPFFIFLKHKKCVTTWLVFLSSREKLSKPGNNRQLFYSILGPSPLSFGSLRSSQTERNTYFNRPFISLFLVFNGFPLPCVPDVNLVPKYMEIK